MPITIETVVYTLPELTPVAQEKARDWYRSAGVHDDWDDAVLEDFETICDLLGLTLCTRSVKTLGGQCRQVSNILYRGFSSQGDGASFEAYYAYKSGALASIVDYCNDDTLHSIAKNLQNIQRRHFYQLTASIRQSGRYVHARTMSCDVIRDSAFDQTVSSAVHDELDTEFRRLADWLYAQLEREYDFHMSDTSIDDALIANEYTFTSDGIRFG